MISVYNSEGDVIGQVEYNDNLDYWDGRNYTNGGTGLHKGLTRLSTGEYVLIHGTQWQGDRDHAETISAERALQEILKSENQSLLKEKKFSELNELYSKTMAGEME